MKDTAYEMFCKAVRKVVWVDYNEYQGVHSEEAISNGELHSIITAANMLLSARQGERGYD